MNKFTKKCDYCHKNDVYVYATGVNGDLPLAYCGKVCESNAKYDKKFDKRFSK